MYRRTAIAAMFLLGVLQAAAQPPDKMPPVVLKSTSRAVQMDVFVNDASGRPVHGLQKSDFVVIDNGRPREIRIFAGEVDAGQTESPSARVPGTYSNRFGVRDSPIVTAIVIDAIPRPDGLQNNAGDWGRPAGGRQPLTRDNTGFWFAMTRAQARSAIFRMAPGQTMAIFAACPELRVIEDFTSNPDRLLASLEAFVPPRVSNAPVEIKKARTIDVLVPPMLSVLRDAAGRMSGAAGRKSVVWISQAYGTELNLSAVSGATQSTVATFNDANVPLYAVDSRFNPTCQGDLAPGESGTVSLACSQPPDVSDEWMEYLAQATGGRAFSGGNVTAVRGQDAGTRSGWGRYEMDDEHGVVSEALRFATEGSRYSYQIGFYVPEADLDGKFHVLRVTVLKPDLYLRYRSGYTASDIAGVPSATPNQIPAASVASDEVGIDAKVDRPAGTRNELRVSLALAPETVTRAADGAIVLDATFIQTEVGGKEVAKFQETVRAVSPEPPTSMVRFDRSLKLNSRAVFLRITIRDQATNRVGSLTIPVEKP